MNVVDKEVPEAFIKTLQINVYNNILSELQWLYTRYTLITPRYYERHTIFYSILPPFPPIPWGLEGASKRTF